MEFIQEVIESENGYSIVTNQHSGFFLDKKYGVKPKVGDTVSLDLIWGSEIRGIKLNNNQIFYKTDEQLEQERKEWLTKNEQKKQETFAKNKENLDADYNALPDVFKRRIDKFRNTNPRFRVDYESYEMFCCKQAIIIADTLKNIRALKKFSKIKYEKQKKLVPKLENSHSGNTFGMSCRLAYWYLTNPENVVKEHGALASLVGCKNYGCPHQGKSQ